MRKSWSSELDRMVSLYFSEKLSTHKVGEKIGCSYKTVEYQLKKNGYKLRSRSESLIGREVSDKVRETARALGKRQVGEKNPTWKGKVNRQGYIGIRKVDHPNASKDGYVMEHRLVMEKAIGRFLEKDEDVHHINGDKKDNRLENLMLMKKSEHSRFHGYQRISDGTHNNFIKLDNEDIKNAIMQGGTVKNMADRLGIERSTLYKKIKRNGLQDWYNEWRSSYEHS